MHRIVALFLFVALGPAIALAQPFMEDSIGRGDKPGASSAEITATLQSDTVKSLVSPGTMAYGATDLDAWAKKAKTAYITLNSVAGPGDVSTSYDVILQPGHFNRTTGATGGEGKYVLEREVVAWIVSGIATDLKTRGLKVAVIPADGFNRPLNTKVFISLHTDSTKFHCSVGPSIGYSGKDDALGMHGIAAALAITLGLDPVKFMNDNYTKNLSGYYAFSAMNVDLFEGVLEMSELTCEDQEANLLSRADVLMKNLAIAIVFAVRPPS